MGDDLSGEQVQLAEIGPAPAASFSLLDAVVVFAAVVGMGITRPFFPTTFMGHLIRQLITAILVLAYLAIRSRPSRRALFGQKATRLGPARGRSGIGHMGPQRVDHVGPEADLRLGRSGLSDLDGCPTNCRDLALGDQFKPHSGAATGGDRVPIGHASGDRDQGLAIGCHPDRATSADQQIPSGIAHISNRNRSARTCGFR